MSELKAEQYKQLQQRVNTIPWTQFSQFLSWTYEGRKLTIDDFPDANEARRQLIEEALLSAPNPQEQADWNELAQYIDNVPNEVSRLEMLISKFNRYISRWSGTGSATPHIETAQAKLVEFMESYNRLVRELEDGDWDNVDQLSIDSILKFYRKYPMTTRKGDIDDTVFSLVQGLAVDRAIPEMGKYKTYFPNGRHFSDANLFVEEAIAWKALKDQRDLYLTFEFVKKCEQSEQSEQCEQSEKPRRFLQDAKVLLLDLKDEEINTMKAQFNEYSRNKLLDLLEKGIFTENELMYNGIVTNSSLNILRNYQEVRANLPILDDVIPRCRCECFPNHVDVFMFGIPATGKSCILAGLISANEMNYDSVQSGGAYAQALSDFLDNNCPPDPTRKNYLTTIKSWVQEGDLQHNFNLVEMAGEEFADKIANNPDNELSFEDMGTGATDLLQSENKKIFFLVVDPTKAIIRFTVQDEVIDESGNVTYLPRVIVINQKHILKRMVDLFAQPENASVMKKVEAIHFIVTKSDTIGNTEQQRIDNAVDLMKSKYANAIATLKDVCAEYGINRATNGAPHVFPFSLGQFYIGNICEYDDTDSSTIIRVMRGNTPAIRKVTFWDRFKNLMNGR